MEMDPAREVPVPAVRGYVLRPWLDVGSRILERTAPIVGLHDNHPFRGVPYLYLTTRVKSAAQRGARRCRVLSRWTRPAGLAYRRSVAEILEEGTFDPAGYADELAAAPTNLDVGTSLLFRNDRVKVWEVRLEPGDRGPFHAHTRPYFWTCVDPGVGRQRAPDGTLKVRRYERGETLFSDHSPDDATLHDLENVGETSLRFITVELLA